ncbi:MAG TPA: AI-2E family transporter [Cyanobacteria bacterium UBA11149]|nr:AI-2E family transporter [Cyanobacteria bacterium UBA11367]HBE56605.1 AI-2E family transporter [Cyanobacteria bacterium UBA11366]HBK65088.1 AI-2E family transporter [Cyanobacteria bacterium UBA11166]HBR73820.1 AI-2E family transporter [Cyanobacteria bacterium UBA11159]HBS70063.1 AI-2E family transporter [Cyanobacteria bacterium UBA11153]HBW87692.1 AI-2E family transporter [Cyanobacteria bacterium UBA11149]
MDSINKLPRQFTIGLIFPIVCLNVWLLLLLAKHLQPLVSILITATLIAFLLDYPIRFLKDIGVRRGIAVAFVLILFLVILGTLVLFIGPLILQQANELLIKLPDWIKSGQTQLQSLETWAVAQQLPVDISSTFTQLVERLTSQLRSMTSQLLNLIVNTIGSIVNVFLTIIFAIFLVLRGESLWNGILSWFPDQWNNQIRKSLPHNFERFIAGQAILATILGTTQTTAFLILGVPLAELFGFGIGAASLIPLGGTTTTIIVSLLIALQNFWLGVKVLLIALAIIQVCENILGPRIVGELTGLNPVWMLISLDIGVKVGGVLGLLVAVPMASFIKGTFDTIRTEGIGKNLAQVETEMALNPEVNEEQKKSVTQS